MGIGRNRKPDLTNESSSEEGPGGTGGNVEMSKRLKPQAFFPPQMDMDRHGSEPGCVSPVDARRHRASDRQFHATSTGAARPGSLAGNVHVPVCSPSYRKAT